MRRTCLATVGSLLASLTFAGGAAGQTTEGFAIDRFEPSERGSEWFVLDSLDLRGHARPAVGVVADYAWKPLVFYDADGNEVRALVENQLFAHVGASLVLWDRVRFGANLPVALLVDGNQGTLNGAQLSADTGAHLGDLRLSGDVRLFGEYRSPITGALGVSFWIPTGSRDAYTSDGKLRVAPHFAVAGEISPFVYAAKVAFDYRAQDDVFAGQSLGSEVTWAASAGVRVADERLVVGPEFYGSTIVKDGAFSKQGTPLELIFGGHYLIGSAFRVGAGVGPGLTQGFGTPALRVVGSLEWVPQIEKAPPPPPEEPEDRDGDGILDRVDACPDEKGVASDDPKKNGCPIPDTDGDGIKDPEDACPEDKGIPTDDPKTNGCPDRDGDKILDAVDACPDEKGVADEDPKKNGCPPPKDTDGDTIFDPEDACPKAPGPRNDDPKKNGCPAARIEQGQIRIVEQVQFKTNSDVILPVSDTILDAVLKILKEHPEITKISVEGHTDNHGSAAHNQKLSEKRAASVVRWLMKHGVEAKRLASAGFGMDRPLDTNATEEGRQMNRRVEFHIREIDGKPADSDSVKE